MLVLWSFIHRRLCCSKGNVEDKILVPKLPKNCARCAKCGHPVNGPYCQGCTLLREKLKEDLVSYFQNFQNISESSDDSANVVNAPREPFVVKQDHGVNPPHIDECCCECGDALYGIYCQQCICKSCGKDYEVFYFDDDHIEEISSGSTTTHSDISLSEYDSFVFDPSNDQFPPTDRNDFTHEEFADKLAHIMSPLEYDCFFFWNFPDPVEDDYSPLLTYVVWIFLAYLTYPVIPPYLHSFRNEDTIFNPGITINRVYSFKPGLSHRSRTFKKFNTHCSHLNECLMIINGKNTPILDIVINSNDDYSSNDDDSLYNENIEYVEASPHNSKLVSLEVAEIVISKDEETEDDNLHEKLLNVNLLVAKIEALKDNPTPSFEFLTKSSSTSPKSFLEETNTFDNSLPEFENFCFDLEEISSGSTTTHSNIYLPDYEDSISMTIILKRLVVAVPLLILIFLFLNMIRLSLIF
nr:hypothetical protein [Tanacetum cinerariifolium]